MPRPFRFTPPEPRPALLTRPRLLRVALGRWDHRITSVVAGPGFGKTTLLIQAMAENRLAPRGEDVWLGIEPQDADGDSLALAAAAALGGQEVDDGPRAGSAEVGPAAAPDPVAVADAVWRRAPVELCLFLDDVHLLPPDSPGAGWLQELVKALPANGHVVLASRAALPMPLARLETHGAVLRIGEDDLRFSDEEVAEFAARRGTDPERLSETAGWPAMVELAASVDRPSTKEFLWEEVLEPLGAERRQVLAALCDLGGADDELISAAVSMPVTLSSALDGVPLVSRAADSWYVAHPLWRTAPGVSLTPAGPAEIRRRAVQHLRDRGRFDEAFALLDDADLWDEAPAVLRAACLTSDRLVASQLDRWLTACPETVRTSPAGALAAALQVAFTRPADAVEPLRTAAARCRDDGDIEAELTAIAELGRLAWWRQDLTPMTGGTGLRVLELAAAGHPAACDLAAFGRAIVADATGDDATVLAGLADIESGVLDPGWKALASWLRGVVQLDLGEIDAVMTIIEGLPRTRDPALRIIFDALRLRTSWTLGRVDEVLDQIPRLLAEVRAAGVGTNVYMALSHASIVLSHAGDVPAARRCLDEAEASIPPGGRPVRTALALASLQLAEGDEDEAATTLRDAIEAHGLGRGIDRRGWRSTIPLSYVLCPETRAHWDELPLSGPQATSRALAAVLVSFRSGDPAGQDRLRELDLSDLGAVRGALHFRFAAELAVGLSEAGRPEGPQLLEATGSVGRSAVRTLTSTASRTAKPARALLAAVPAPPARPSFLAVLGPLALHRDGPDGDEVDDPTLRRKRVRALLAFLVSQRTTSRAAITAAVWPDLDQPEANNNLAVTLNYLLRVLEPWRAAGEPAYLVRLDGDRVRLVTGEYLHIDIDQFDHELAAAHRAELDGTPSVALQHHLAAVDLYRGALHADLPDALWIDLDREHYRARFTQSATRAGQLLWGQGDTQRAQDLARRALAVDPWAEHAHTLLAASLLATGDRAAARRAIDRCLSMLTDLGVEPSEPTRQLHRRIRSGRPSRPTGASR